MTLDYAVTRWRAVDGDTVDLDVGMDVNVAPGWVSYVRNTTPYHVRLIILDTPERGQLRYREATTELAAWLTAHTDRLRVEVYGSAGWDRDLADVYVAGDRGNTATQAMLRAGWPVYVGR